MLDDLFLVYDIRMERRESLNGHETIVFSLTPRPDAKPRTREGSQMRKFAVRAWVSESDRELVRVDAEAIDTLSMGFGLLARLHKGAMLSFLRTKVNDEVWLPVTGQLQRQRAGRPRRRTPAQRHVRIFGLPKVLGRYLDDVSAADSVADFDRFSC